MKQHIHILVFCVAAILASVSGQDAANARDEIWLSRLGVERGLSNNHVVGIAQDKHGFIWVATDEGLNRFDGHGFKTYFKDELTNASGLTGNELNGIIDDPRRPVLWIATQRAGLNAYDYEKDVFTSYRHTEDSASIATDDVMSVTPASDGGIWVATYWRGIDHLDPGSGKFTHFNSSTVKGMPDASVWRVLDGGDGFLYVVHEHHGFTIIDISRMTARNFLPDPGKEGSLPTDNLKCVYKDSLDNIWIGGATGLILFNRDDNSFTDFGEWHRELRHSVEDIRQFSDNRLWVAMERGGIAYMTLADSVFSNPQKMECVAIGSGTGRNLLSSPSIRCLFQDIYSNIWAGSWGGGINLIRKEVPPFGLHAGGDVTSGEVTSANSVFTVLLDDGNRLWVGKDGGGLDVYDGDRKLRSYTVHDGLPGDIVQSSWKSPDGKLWFGFFKAGAVVYDPSSGTFSRVFPAGSRVDVRDITGLDDGRVVLASSQGVWIYNRDKKETEGPYAVGNNLVRRVFPVSDKMMLVGTFGAGLWITDYRFMEARCLDVASGLPSNTVNDIFRSRDGCIWVATGEGLLEFPDILADPSEFNLVNRAAGLDNSHVQAIAQDRGGNIWISTNNGISCLTSEGIHNYSHRDYVPLGNFLTHSVASDRQGNLYFGAISGLCMFNPVRVLEKMPAPPAVLIELSIPNPPNSPSCLPTVIQLSGKEEVRLNPGQSSFDISFTTGNFAIAGEVEYAYMLSGLDEDWTMAMGGNMATYRDLPAGNYVFKVKTRLRNQEWGEVSEVRIILPPPFWKSWWARIIWISLVIAIVGMLFYLYRRRVNAESQLHAEKERHLREQELNDERLRFYTNITHELRTPLSLIVGPLEDLSRSGHIPEKERRSIEMVERNACRLLDLVNRILEFRKTETRNRRLCVCRGNIASVVYEVALKYKELNRNRNVKVNVATDSGEMEAVFDKEVVTVILDNLISNALKYTKEGSVDIACHKNAGWLTISVADSGVGISGEAIPHIFDRYYQERGPHQAAGTGIGLSLVRNLVDLHHGTVSVESEPGNGAVFTVTLPAEGDYPEALHTEEAQDTCCRSCGNEVSSVVAGSEKPVVLVVEDNADIRDYIRQSFTDLYDVRCAENGEEGLELAFKLIPAIVVSDIMMPVMDGVEMTRKLKGDLRTSHIPVILLTAKVSDTDRAEGYENGADSYLTKPFSASLLQSRINNLLLQRMKLADSFNRRREIIPHSVENDGESLINSLERKREELLNSLGKAEKEFLERLDGIISGSLPGENVDVNFISGALCMSSSTLYRKVKAITGLSPNEYIRKTKMHIAEKLIIGGQFTMSEVAYKVGINSAAYFRQCFKEEFGMLPSEYLKQILKK